jgi:uncharacterized protein YndB with AHSA1/START domain
MTEKPAVHSVFAIERTYAAPPAKVFAAFADPAVKRRWHLDGKGVSLATVELSPTDHGGTRLLFTEQAAFFEPSDGARLREAGWRGLLANLEKALQHIG